LRRTRRGITAEYGTELRDSGRGKHNPSQGQRGGSNRSSSHRDGARRLTAGGKCRQPGSLVNTVNTAAEGR